MFILVAIWITTKLEYLRSIFVRDCVRWYHVQILCQATLISFVNWVNFWSTWCSLPFRWLLRRPVWFLCSRSWLFPLPKIIVLWGSIIFGSCSLSLIFPFPVFCLLISTLAGLRSFTLTTSHIMLNLITNLRSVSISCKILWAISLDLPLTNHCIKGFVSFLEIRLVTHEYFVVIVLKLLVFKIIECRHIDKGCLDLSLAWYCKKLVVFAYLSIRVERRRVRDGRYVRVSNITFQLCIM